MRQTSLGPCIGSKTKTFAWYSEIFMRYSVHQLFWEHIEPWLWYIILSSLHFELRIYFISKNERGKTTSKKHFLDHQSCISLTISTRSKAPVHAPTEMAFACISCLVVDWFIDPCCRGVEIKVSDCWRPEIWWSPNPRNMMPLCIPQMSFRNTANTYVNDISAMHYKVPEHGKYMCHFGLGQQLLSPCRVSPEWSSWGYWSGKPGFSEIECYGWLI